MPVTRSDLNLPSSWTLDNLSAFLRQAMTQAGMSAQTYDAFVSGESRFLIWEQVTDSARTYGKFYYVLEFDQSRIRQTVLSEYDPDSDSFPDEVIWSEPYSINSFSEYTAITLRSSESALVVFRSENQREPVLLGWLRPANRPAFWDENLYPYVFVQTNRTEWMTTERTPYRFFDGETMQVGRFRANLNDPFPSSPNPVNGVIDVLTGVYLYADFSEGQGIVGAFSSDWGRATDRISISGNLIATSNGNQYTIFTPSPDFGVGAGVVRSL